MTTDVNEDGDGGPVQCAAPALVAAGEGGPPGGRLDSDGLSLSIGLPHPTTGPAPPEPAIVADSDSTAHGLTRLVHQETRATDDEAVGWPAPPPFVVVAVAGLSIVAAGLGLLVWRSGRRSGGPRPHAERLAWKKARGL